MENLFYKLYSIILSPLSFAIFYLSPKSSKTLIKYDFIRWADWQSMPANIITFGFLFAKLKEFRSVIYQRLGWRKYPWNLIFKGQTNLLIACKNIGPGLIVQHGYSTVVVAESIGRNFHVNQCVNIVWNGDKRCTIGDNVMVCAGAIIVGGIKIGDNVTIGAGAVVVKDVPSNSTIVGNPSRIITQ